MSEMARGTVGVVERPESLVAAKSALRGVLEEEHTYMSRTVPPELQKIVRGAYQALMAKQGGARRRGQQIMIAEIAKAVVNARKLDEEGTGSRLLAIDAPTGSGKTFSYLVGAVPIALANGLKVVLSTGKVSLMEQLQQRDLVALEGIIPGMRVAVVKGRGRWCCPVRTEQLAAEGGEAGAVASSLCESLRNGSWTGDVDELAEQPPKAIWMRCTNDSKGCAGRKCSAYDRCPYYASRKEAATANVYLTNHDMLLADIQAGHVMLPRPEDAVIVIDEAHTFPEKAVESLANGDALGDAQEFVFRCGMTVAGVRKADKGGACATMAAQAMSALEMMAGALSEAQMAIGSLGKTTDARDDKRPVRFSGGKLPAWLERAAQSCRDSAQTAAEAMRLLMESLQGDDGDGLADKVRERLLSDVGAALGRVERILSVWKLMAAGEGADGPVAKWIEVCGEERDIRVCASPIGVGDFLHGALWSKVAAAIHLSGTLTTVGGLEPYLRESGLDRTPGTRTLEVESPFNHQEQATLIVPKGVKSPKDAQEHTQWLIDHIPAMLSKHRDGEGALVLFTSFAQLRTVADAMPVWVKDMLLAQDVLSKREVVSRHMEAVKAGRKSVIFGTSSYEEGIDLPGKLCSLVVIAKLQFAVPNDPVSEELRDHLAAQGRDHFLEICVPKACRRLAQSTGRLIRTETDTGCIVVADPRLTGTSYGRSMVKSLPPYRFATDLALAA